jgi:NADPH-dependent curcumin reductase CurA
MTAVTHTSREIHLAQRPHGAPDASTFALEQVALGAPGEGELLVRNRWMSVDPYMRGRMSEGRRSYVGPYEVGAPLDGGAVGEVVASGDARFAPGDIVLHGLGWRELALVPADHARPIDPAAAGVPEQAFLGILGMPGLTAYAGVVEVAPVRDGDVVFVSAAAGAVGSAAGQFARKLGAARVIGSAGGPDKCRHVVEELGFDAAIDYKAGGVKAQLRSLAPDGVDVFFDNVGGEQLDAALSSLRTHGRIAICGAISHYNATESVPGPPNLSTRLVVTRGSVRGMLVRDHAHLYPRFLTDVGGWLADGSVSYRETVREGIESAPQAFIDLLAGANTGKMLVRLG